MVGAGSTDWDTPLPPLLPLHNMQEMQSRVAHHSHVQVLPGVIDGGGDGARAVNTGKSIATAAATCPQKHAWAGAGGGGGGREGQSDHAC